MSKTEDFYTYLEKIKGEPLLKWQKFLAGTAPDVAVLDDLADVKKNKFNAEPVKSTFTRKVNRKTKRW